MTRRRQTTQLVPVEPAHRRTWRSLWRRCSCGLPTPCVDRLLPAKPLPFPPRARVRRATIFRSRPRVTRTDLTLERPSPGFPSVPLPPRRRPSPPQPIPRQERRTTKDRQPLSLRSSAPVDSRAQFAGRGSTSVSLSQGSPGGGIPMRNPSSPGSLIPHQRGRPTAEHTLGSPSRKDSLSPDGTHNGGDRPLRNTQVTKARGRPWPIEGRPAMAYHQINLRHW